MDRRFTRARRLTAAKEYRAVFERARACGGDHFTLLAAPNQRGIARLGLAIAKRRVPRASRRNLIKRIVRESFRHHHPPLAGYDIVVLAKPAAASAPRGRLRRVLDAQWQRLGRRLAEPGPGGAR